MTYIISSDSWTWDSELSGKLDISLKMVQEADTQPLWGVAVCIIYEGNKKTAFQKGRLVRI